MEVLKKYFKKYFKKIFQTGVRGPGVFFIIPCVDVYEVIDMRVQNFSVPPQEVNLLMID